MIIADKNQINIGSLRGIPFFFSPVRSIIPLLLLTNRQNLRSIERTANTKGWERPNARTFLTRHKSIYTEEL